MLKIVYHSADLDGFCSGAQLRQQAELHSRKFEMIPWDYNDPIPHFEEGDNIWMADISLPPEVMLRHKHQISLWFDHHVSAIDKSIKYGYQDLGGLRHIGDSASLLVNKFWRAEGQAAPMIVTLVDRYDVWKQDSGESGFSWQEILEYQFGMRIGLFNPIDDSNFKEWNDLLLGRSQWKFPEFREDGIAILKHLSEENKFVAAKAQRVLFEIDGKPFTLAVMNTLRADREVSNFIPFSHDGIAAYHYDGKGLVVFSLRKDDNSPANIVGLALANGGGGHACACGFSVPYEVFHNDAIKGLISS